MNHSTCKLCGSTMAVLPLCSERVYLLNKNKRLVSSLEYPDICVADHQNERRRVRGQNKRFPVHKRIKRLYTHEWVSILKAQDFSCAICRMPVTNKNLTLDHVVQLGKGGDNLITNVQPLCGDCHAIKDNHRFKKPMTFSRKARRLWRRKKMVLRIAIGFVPLQMLVEAATLVVFVMLLSV